MVLGRQSSRMTICRRCHRPRQSVTLPLIKAHWVRKLRMLVTFQRGRRDVGRVYLSPARVATVRSLRDSSFGFSMPKCNTRKTISDSLLPIIASASRASLIGPLDALAGMIPQGLRKTPVRAWQFGKSADRLTFREQLVGRFVQMPLGGGIWQMSNQLSGKLVNVAAFEGVELLSLGIEDSRTNDDRYEGATTIEYISIHDRPPIEVPHGKR
jgi:hypothetical protein